MRSLFVLILCIFLQSGCTTSPLSSSSVPRGENAVCNDVLNAAPWDNEVKLLRTTQVLFTNRCFKETITLSHLLREGLRDKSYSVSGEVVSLLGPESMTQTYVLESHERVYLSILSALSFLGMKQKEDAEVELRRASQELDAVLYNHGRDDVSALLLAGVWDQLDHHDIAAPYWRRLGIDPSSLSAETKQIYGLGSLQGYDWRLRLTSQSSYEIHPQAPLPEKCVSATGVRIPITDWVRKIQARQDPTYHPLLSLKSYLRFPVGVSYGLLLGTSGLSVAILGCGLTAQYNSSGDLCETAIRIGGKIISETPNAFNYAVQPDLRHWPETPTAFLVTSARDLEKETCAQGLTGQPILAMP